MFKVPESTRKYLIENHILDKIPIEKRTKIRSEIEKIVENYEGSDFVVLDILEIAVKQNNLEEYILLLNDYSSGEAVNSADAGYIINRCYDKLDDCQDGLENKCL